MEDNKYGEAALKTFLTFLHVIWNRDPTIISRIAPVQPMDEGKEKGVVYFKNIVIDSSDGR